MSMWTAIALICIAGIIGDAYRRRHDGSKARQSAEQLDQLSERLDALETELRERVEVLERIVTDRSEDLKRQFDHLDKAS
jgi:hypothetical protein